MLEVKQVYNFLLFFLHIFLIMFWNQDYIGLITAFATYFLEKLVKVGINCSLKLEFYRAKVFDFDEVQFINLLFMDCAFGVMFVCLFLTSTRS